MGKDPRGAKVKATRKWEILYWPAHEELIGFRLARSLGEMAVGPTCRVA
jgi:hypothetical protein